LNCPRRVRAHDFDSQLLLPNETALRVLHGVQQLLGFASLPLSRAFQSCLGDLANLANFLSIRKAVTDDVAQKREPSLRSPSFVPFVRVGSLRKNLLRLSTCHRLLEDKTRRMFPTISSHGSLSSLRPTIQLTTWPSGSNGKWHIPAQPGQDGASSLSRKPFERWRSVTFRRPHSRNCQREENWTERCPGNALVTIGNLSQFWACACEVSRGTHSEREFLGAWEFRSVLPRKSRAGPGERSGGGVKVHDPELPRP